ncbi:MAG: molybdopterin-dependent oxidoreductase, partial [Desulfovibrionaceae bacterium]
MDSTTACTLDCPDVCSLLASTRDGRLKVRPNPDHPFTRGFACAKVQRHLKQAFGPERITEPLLRDGGGFRPVCWDEALDWAAQRIQALRDTPEAVLHLRGHGYRGVLARASTAFFGRLGASTTRGSLCDEAGIAAQIRDFGELDHNDPEDLVNARRIVLFGRDLPACSIHTHKLVLEARKAGARVLVVSPGADHNGELPDQRILLRPGADRFLAAAALKVLFEAGGVPERAQAAAANVEGLLAELDRWSVAELCAAAGAAPADAEALAGWYAGDEPASTLIAWGLQRYEHGAENVRFIDALCALSGQMGRPGATANFNIGSARNLGPWPGGLGQPARALLLPRLAEELERAEPPVE